MADAKLTALSELSVAALEDLAYIVDDPAGTPASTKLSLNRLGGLFLAPICTGRLTTETGVPVSTADRTAQSTIYFTPYHGNRVALYDGTRWKLYAFSEVSLALGTLTSGANYDVFLYDNVGTLTLELSAAWTNDTTRADALALQDGVNVKDGAITRRYVGTIRTTATTTIEDSRAKRFVWSTCNRIHRPLYVHDSTNSWTYGTATWRQANAVATNQVEAVVGLVGALVELTLHFAVNAFAGGMAIGVDSVTAPHADNMGVWTGYSAVTFPGSTTLRHNPTPGYHYYAWLEKAGGATHTVYGDDGGDHCRSGISGTVEC